MTLEKNSYKFQLFVHNHTKGLDVYFNFLKSKRRLFQFLKVYTIGGIHNNGFVFEKRNTIEN